MTPADVRKAARFGPTAIFLGLFYVVVCFLYFRNSLQGSGYLTKLAPAQRTLTQLLAPLAAAAGVDEQDAQDVLEAAKDRWLSDDMLNVTVAALTLLRLMHDPIAKSHPPTEAAALQEYEAGLAQIRTGTTKTLMGALLMLSEPEALAGGERRLLANAVDRFLEHAHRLLPGAARAPMVDQLELLVVKEKDEIVKAKLESAAKHLGG